MFSINMAKKIVTNLRINEADWLQIKAMAAELNISANQYIIELIESFSLKQELALDEKDLLPKKDKKYSIWNLADLANIKDKPMGSSEEDEIIYGG